LALSYWIDYLDFITEEKLAVVFITPSLGVLNWSVIYIINTAPLAMREDTKIETNERELRKKLSKEAQGKSIDFSRE
jgi:hypothetical protein